ncbi:MAG: hypothetical protein WCI18_05155 [Pseudomonadota bacterium]
MNLKPHEHQIYLIADMKPWALSLPAKLKLIGPEGAEVQVNPSDFRFEPKDWDTILASGQKMSLQLNHSFEHLDIPVVPALVDSWRLIRESNILHVHLRILGTSIEFTEFLAHI